MSAGDKAPPKGALEEAVALFDELVILVQSSPDTDWKCESCPATNVLVELLRRRAALEPRLAKRRENQAKPRTAKPRTDKDRTAAPCCGLGDGHAGPCLYLDD